MERFHLPQFRIQSLMLLIGAIACALALVQRMGPLVAILILVYPSSLLVEHLFGAKPPLAYPQPSLPCKFAQLVVLILCATLCTVAAWYGSSTGMPTILSPLPLFVVVPLLFASMLHDTNPWWLVAPIPFGTFLLMNSYQVRAANPAPLRIRFTFLLGLATVLTVPVFLLDWQFAVHYHGVSFTLASAAINASFLLVLWCWWLAIRQRASKTSALGFATLLHCWLFWFAFPYLGELP